jgi:hypothetical protein
MMHPDAMARSIARRPVALVLVAVLVAACGETEPAPSDEVTSHDLAEPYQVQPFAIDPGLIAVAERLCRDPQMAMVPVGAQLVVVDARGENRLLLLFGGPGSDAQCFLRRERNGELRSEGGGSGSGDVEPVLGRNELRDRGGGSQSSIDGAGNETTQSYAIGRIGVNVARVELVLGDGVVITASANRGWFGAWWPGSESTIGYRWYDAAGRLLGSTG